MELTSCPECGMTAEVIWRFYVDSTDGPLEHVNVLCVDRHRFLGLADHLLPAEPPHPARVGEQTHQTEGPETH